MGAQFVNQKRQALITFAFQLRSFQEAQEVLCVPERGTSKQVFPCHLRYRGSTLMPHSSAQIPSKPFPACVIVATDLLASEVFIADCARSADTAPHTNF